MLSAGTNIQSVGDPLKPLSVEHLYSSLRNPTPLVESRIRQLRIVRQTDEKLYSRAKRLLPYFVCAVFNPSIRKSENFAYASCFIVDLDCFSERGLDLTSTRHWIESDPRVMLSFVSPSQDGLKVLFRLKERCYDAGHYSVFYKEFVRRFSGQYHLELVADSRTCDVTRACFISVDPDVYYNAEEEPVDINDYLNLEDPFSMSDLKHSQDLEEKQEEPSDAETAKGPSEPEDDVLAKIKEKLGVRQKAKEQLPHLPIYVPERLTAIMDGLCQFIDDQGVTVYETQDIQYGKKIKCKLGARLAEVNLFYGKRGFSVVQTPKSIVSSELNKVVAELIQVYLDDNT